MVKNAPADSIFGSLDLGNVAFHGWSGGAQMVSWLFQASAVGQLPGYGVAGGIMTAGGSYQCYNDPPNALDICSNCSVDTSHYMKGCSDEIVSCGMQPTCEYCCPTHHTEDWYKAHPEDYKTHPWTFLAQSDPDNYADSCASKHYHDEMRRNNAYSELHTLTGDAVRCYAVGDPSDPTVPAADNFSKFCNNPNMTSWNHTMLWSALVEPVTQFLLNAFENNSKRQEN
eukprot:m.78621 g.78621  ORF g.78621 m.78621 type:complete len:227 (+) comp12679_c0_seq2:1313-1993(+)